MSSHATSATDPVFVALQKTGPDPFRDEVVFVEAATFGSASGRADVIPGSWLRPVEFGRLAGSVQEELLAAGFPVDRQPELPASEHLAQLMGPLAGRSLVVASEPDFLERQFRRYLPEATPPHIVDLESVAAFVQPSRGERDYASLRHRLLGSSEKGAVRAADLRELCEALVRAHLMRPELVRQLFSRSVDELRVRCVDDVPRAALWLEFIWNLLNRPSTFASGRSESDFAKTAEADFLRDGIPEEDLDGAPLEAERLLPRIQPRFSTEYREYFSREQPLDARLEEGCDSNDHDMQIMEDYFDALPQMFQQSAEPSLERPGQRALGHAVMQSLEQNSFLIGDAPTGTGKTLAYLAPVLIWASAKNVRVGLSTYTRALQEQVFFREVPRALRLLKDADFPQERLPRVSLLKGRANYICGRAIIDSAPEAGENSPQRRATWLRLALYFCEDASADLDGFPLSPGIPLGNASKLLREARAVLNSVRAIPRCCEGKPMLRCAAGVRGLRAERSHLVVTNHAFVLARPEYFSHLIVDECDHLHEVTVSARSYDIELDEVVSLAEFLLRGRGHETAPLARLAQVLTRLPFEEGGERLREAATQAAHGAKQLDSSAHETARDLRTFRQYRKEVGEGLSPEERAFLLHDYLTGGRGEQLATSLHHLKKAVDQLDSSLRTIIEELGNLSYRKANRLRWSLRRPIDQLDHWREGLEHWLGGETGDADFSEDLHYDAVFEQRRRPLLTLKWLLPQKWLGETYYPGLKSACLVSATARLHRGFKAMKAYLGLDILEEDQLDRPGRTVHEFAGPQTFDPQAALVCVPEDAPPFAHGGPGANAYLEYVEDFLLYLAERTQGRVLGLFTNRMTLRRVAERLQDSFRARGVPLYWQGMPDLSKEEMMQRFRTRVDSVLLGLDTFWYGVDFPGETLQYVVVTKLPYGALDDYLYAQRARMGFGPHRNRIYLPKALAMFRQGCGRLLRNEQDRGVVFVLDRRVLEKRHANFLEELPRGAEEYEEPNLLRAPTDNCLHKAFAHMHLQFQIQQRGLAGDFSSHRGQMTGEE